MTPDQIQLFKKALSCDAGILDNPNVDQITNDEGLTPLEVLARKSAESIPYIWLRRKYIWCNLKPDDEISFETVSRLVKLANDKY